MEQKVILKNINKFDNLYLAKGIDLLKFRYFKRKDFSFGISTSKYSDKWFNLPKGAAIFKTFDDNEFIESKNYRMINELVCNKLANQLNIPCAEYEPATYEEDTGLVTYNVAKHHEKLINSGELYRYNIKENSYEEFDNLIDYYKDRDIYNINKKQVMLDIYKIMVFDALTMQQDRHLYNIHFIIDKLDNSLKVAPLIDNEFAFSGKTFNSFLKYEREMNQTYMVKTAYKDAFTIAAKNYEKKFALDIDYVKNVENLVKMAKDNEVRKKILLDYVNNFDINSAIFKVELMGNDIPSAYKQYMRDLVDISKTVFKKFIKKYNLQINNDLQL